MLRTIWYRWIAYWYLPAPLRFASHMAWQMEVRFHNPRNRDQWLNQLVHHWRRWRNRAKDPIIGVAYKLLTEGWQLASDWPLVPPETGEPFYGLKLAKGGFPYADRDKVIFAWDTEDDKKSVPVERVYVWLGLPHQTTANQLLAWEVCFWLSFLTEVKLGQAVDEERRQWR